MALPPSFLDELRARTPLASLVGRKTRLVKSGRNWKGCCPFHSEKSPSFYTYEDGYHCFGCGAHGDAITFVMQTEGQSFMDAVHRLAGEAGLEVPKQSPEHAARDSRARDLHAVMEAAAEAFARRLRLPEGRAGLDYLYRRGLTEQTIAQFGLGWAGQGRGSLLADLRDTGITIDQLMDCGLMREGREQGDPPTDLFYNRVMFPIRDRRGKLIAFGGRILGDGQPKYVNSPETTLFSKRRSLYALDIAKEAAFRHGGTPAGTVVAVEGYMDVIALHQAGFTAAVAPLGTALTEDQLTELWKLTPEPILCFDGDAAGQRAAFRAAELVLPALSPDHRLAFATLPAGEDPDTLVKKGGAAAFDTVLKARRSIEAVLYDIATAEHPGETPIDRAARKNRLLELAGAVGDKSLSAELRSWLLDKFFAERKRPERPPFRPGNGNGNGNGGFGGRGGWNRQPPPVLINRKPVETEAVRLEQTRFLLAILVAHPWLLQDTEEALGTLDLPPGPAAMLRSHIFAWLSGAQRLDSVALVDHLHSAGASEALAWVLRSSGLPAAAQPNAQPSEASEAWWHFFGFLRGEDELQADIAAAQRDWVENNDTAAYQRLLRLTTARNAWRRGEPETAATLD